MIGFNKSVLEVGCSTGYFTKILVERGCSVVGIEIDPEAARGAEEWADRVIVGNIDDGGVGMRPRTSPSTSPRWETCSSISATRSIRYARQSAS